MVITGARRAMLTFVCATAAVTAIEVVAAAHLSAARSPTLVASAITVDLVLGVPLLAWLLVLRHRGGALLVPPIMLAGAVLARAILPAPHDAALDAVAGSLALVELAIVAYGVVRLRALVTAYRSLRPSCAYGFDALEAAARRELGGQARALSVVLTEIAIGGLAVAGWRRRYQPPAGATTYPVHRRNGYAATMAMFASAVVIEILAVHILVQRWNEVVAWVLSATSAYTLVWLLGDYHGLRLNPHVIDGETLHARAGLRWRADIPLVTVRQVRRHRHTDSEAVFSLAIIGDPDVVVELDRPVTVRGLFGIRRQASVLGLTADDPAALISELSHRGA